jgi:glycine hydroxymethyltransferase
MRLNLSGRLYNFISYGVTQDTHRIDFDQVARLAHEHRPKLIVAGASASPREIHHDRFAQIAADVGAKLFVDIAHYAGLVAAGLHHNPIPVADFVSTTTHKTLRGPRAGLVMCRQEYAKELNRSVFPGLQGGPLMHAVAGKAVCFREALQPEFKQYAQAVINNAKTLADELAGGGLRLISGGTDNHLMLVDVTTLGISGKLAEKALERCGITVNMNMVPYDERKPMDPSGIRIGTPAVTTRGMTTDTMRTIGGWMLEALRHPDDAGVHQRIHAEVKLLCDQFPVPAAALETA